MDFQLAMMPGPDGVRALVGVALLTTGMAAVGYATYLEYLSAAALHWWDKAIVLAPAGLLLAIGGVFFVR